MKSIPLGSRVSDGERDRDDVKRMRGSWRAVNRVIVPELNILFDPDIIEPLQTTDPGSISNPFHWGFHLWLRVSADSRGEEKATSICIDCRHLWFYWVVVELWWFLCMNGLATGVLLRQPTYTCPWLCVFDLCWTFTLAGGYMCRVTL